MEKKLQKWLRRGLIGMLLYGLGGTSLVYANAPQYPKIPDLETMRNSPNDFPEMKPEKTDFYEHVNYGTYAPASNMNNIYMDANHKQNHYAQVDPNSAAFYSNGNHGPNPYVGNFNGANFHANANYVPGQYKPETQGSSSWMPSWNEFLRKGSELASRWLPYIPKALAAVSNSSNLVSLKTFNKVSKGMAALNPTTLARNEFLQSFDLIDLSTQEKSMKILEKIINSFIDAKGAAYGAIDLQLIGRIRIYDAGALLPMEWIRACFTNPQGTIDQLAQILRRDVCCLFVKSGRGGRFQNFFPTACYVHYDPIQKRFLQQTASAGMMIDRSVRKSLGTWSIFDRLINGDVLFFVIDQDLGRVRIILPY